jgi:hypothetical protein
LFIPGGFLVDSWYSKESTRNPQELVGESKDLAIGDWLFEAILCRWGALSEIVTDNGGPFVKALGYLSK